MVRKVEAGWRHLLDLLVQWRRLGHNGHSVGVRAALLHLFSVLLGWLFELSEVSDRVLNVSIRLLSPI